MDKYQFYNQPEDNPILFLSKLYAKQACVKIEIEQSKKKFERAPLRKKREILDEISDLILSDLLIKEDILEAIKWKIEWKKEKDAQKKNVQDWYKIG